MTKISHSAARFLLARERQMTSLIDKEIIAAGPDMVFDKSDYVPLYYDLGRAVTSDCGTLTAYRAVTLRGQFLWYVFTPGKARGYHAMCNDPFEAMDMARAAWDHRRAVRQEWDRVEQTARDLILGRQSFDVRVQDMDASALCTLGAQGCRTRFGLGRINRIPGRLAALIMMIEPQMGFVIHAAMVRNGAPFKPLAQDMGSAGPAPL